MFQPHRVFQNAALLSSIACWVKIVARIDERVPWVCCSAGHAATPLGSFHAAAARGASDDRTPPRSTGAHLERRGGDLQRGPRIACVAPPTRLRCGGPPHDPPRYAVESLVRALAQPQRMGGRARLSEDRLPARRVLARRHAR